MRQRGNGEGAPVHPVIPFPPDAGDSRLRAPCRMLTTTRTPLSAARGILLRATLPSLPPPAIQPPTRGAHKPPPPAFSLKSSNTHLHVARGRQSLNREHLLQWSSSRTTTATWPPAASDTHAYIRAAPVRQQHALLAASAAWNARKICGVGRAPTRPSVHTWYQLSVDGCRLTTPWL